MKFSLNASKMRTSPADMFGGFEQPQHYETRDKDIRVNGTYFSSIVAAQNYKIDERVKAPLELWYKNRWHIMGDIPNARRHAL